MLVLTRRPGESVNIGDNIEVTILSVVKTAVRIGISAPKHTKVLRHEIYRKIKPHLGLSGEGDEE